MRTGLVALVVVASSAAHAEVPPPKAAPAGYGYRALEKFVAATVAERRGELREALQLLSGLEDTAPHPHVTFNLARVFMHLELNHRAAELFHAYLTATPGAPDATKITALRDTLRKPQLVTIGGNDNEPASVPATIYIDGTLVGPSPVRVTLAPDVKHRVLRVSARGVGTHVINSNKEGTFVAVRDNVQPGNLLVDGVNGGWYEIGGVSYSIGAPYDVPAGKHAVQVKGVCDAFTVDVSADFTYVFVASGPTGRRPTCTRLSPRDVRVTQLPRRTK